VGRYSPELKSAAIVFFAFVSVHALLLLGHFEIYDLEETEYGNVAVAMLDGHVAEAGYGTLQTDPGEGDALTSGAGRRRRTVWSMEPTVWPFFAVLGPTMLSLKLWALCGAGCWAALWFLLARRLVPEAPRWLPALLFALPLPLIQVSALSAVNITAHLGSSAWQALALLLLVYAADRGGPARLGLAAASGLVAGWGLHCGFSLAPLLLGVVFLAWRVGGLGGLAAWVAGAAPGLAIVAAFADPSRQGGLVARLTGLSGGSAMREGGGPLETLATAAIHWPGVPGHDPSTGELFFPGLHSIVYVALFVAVIGFAAFRGSPGRVDRDLGAALLLGFAGFAGALIVAGFELEPSYFDGLRYLLPLAPAPLLVAVGALRQRPRLVGLLVVAHLGAAGLLFQPSAFPAPWAQLRGYEPTVMKAWMTGPLQADRVADERTARWATWAGLSAARRGEPTDPPDGLDGPALDAWWRGVGVGRILDVDRRGGPIDWIPPGAAGDRVVEGAAWGTAYAGCSDDLRARLGVAASGREAALWYGLGRAEPYCRSSWPAGVGDRAAFDRGVADAWSIDYTLRGEPLDIRIY